MPSESVSDSFREVVIDGVSADIEAIRSEWRSRTAYGKVRILPILMIYPLAAGGMIVAGSAMWVLFSTLVLADWASEPVRERCEKLEPEVYKDAPE